MCSSILWFRHGLRLHDNPALLEAINNASNGGYFYAIFIYDGETAGTSNIGYNRMKFLLESLYDLDSQLRIHGGQLFIFQGDPIVIIRRLSTELNIKVLCYEQDCEPIWYKRDKGISDMCTEIGVRCIEKISHTLYNPRDIIKANGGIPPLTYQMFLHTVDTIGLPTRPEENVKWENVRFGKIKQSLLKELSYFSKIVFPEDFGIFNKYSTSASYQQLIGGERQALILLKNRLDVEKKSYEKGYYLPNQSKTDLLSNTTSLSPHLRYGCLSVRRFYWELHDLFICVNIHIHPTEYVDLHITGQLIWREFFYTMSVDNPKYSVIKENPICLDIPWSEINAEKLDRWKTGNTGYPLIDAAMRQLLSEGWIHHMLRNVTATFLTRGGLWYSWEYGLQHFLKYLLDADWSVCAGNWMWVSSSAFEKLLDSTQCTCPIALGRRIDPNGEFVKKYIPELKLVPKEYIHEPWKLSQSLQKQFNCVIGENYAERIIDINRSSEINYNKIIILRETILQSTEKEPPHCRPSNDDEIKYFFWLSEF